MQTLQAGSFLNLENAASVEALKFTARRLAEQAGNVVKENLNRAALENLTNNLWEKAEYVAREPERRRLREIFTENFTERFRELKPEISLADNMISEVLSAPAATRNDGSEAATAPEIIEGDRSETAIENTFSVSPPKAEATEAQGKRDEFLGFVKTDEPFVAASAAETEVSEAAAQNEAEQETIQTENETASETANSKSERVVAERDVSTESANNKKSPPTASANVSAENNSQAASAGKTTATKTETKEPFEFGKCTINLNLILLPTSGDGQSRKAIISASSHGSPPEIEFLEITDGENLTEIVELVCGKLSRFKNGLPAKYIEQLRQSKTNRAKKTPTVRTPLAVPTKTTANQSKVEKTISEQKSEQASSVETAQPERGVLASSSAFVPPTVNTPIAANEIQGSLF